MKLYNTLTKRIDDLKPLNPPKITLYTCGPTVYDHIHIGNLASFIFADTLRRSLSVNGFEPSHVMNITDVDDKTIRRSHEAYPSVSPVEALKKLTDKYTNTFLGDIEKVGIDADRISFMRATDNITEMQKIIKQLLKSGFAYITDDGIYFSIEAYKKSGKEYGQLAKLSSENTSQARIQNDEYDKESAHDFALWKKQKDDEPAWDFELDGQNMQGRPGWHIECSAMSCKAFGQPFDIHTGGIDLIFPHHENEIAQSTAGEQNPTLAKFFVHNEHILVDGKKMSKSLNNFYTIKDVKDKGYDPLAFRLLILQSHYRSQAHFSWENVEAAQNRLNNWRAVADMRWQPLKATEENEEPFRSELDNAYEAIADYLADDMDMPGLLAKLSSVFKAVEARTLRSEEISYFTRFLERVDEALGLHLLQSKDITTEQKQTIAEREQARADKDWAKSDKLRDKLQEQGIGLRDTVNGIIWYRL